MEFQSRELKQFPVKFGYFVINFHSGILWTGVEQKRALWLLWTLTLILTASLFPMTSLAARGTSVTPGQRTAHLMEPLVARRGTGDTGYQHPRSELCQQNIPSRPTSAFHRTASTLISLTREVSFTTFAQKLSQQLLIFSNCGIEKRVINHIN